MQFEISQSDYMPFYNYISYIGSVAERSKALVLGTSLFGGVGSNPTSAKFILNYISYFYF